MAPHTEISLRGAFLLDAHPCLSRCAAQGGGGARAPVGRPLGTAPRAFGAARSRGCAFGFPRPSPLPSPPLPSLSRPPPPLSGLQLNSPAGVRVRLLSSRASASSGSHPALSRTPPAPLYLPALAGPGGLAGRRSRAHAHTPRSGARDTEEGSK